MPCDFFHNKQGKKIRFLNRNLFARVTATAWTETIPLSLWDSEQEAAEHIQEQKQLVV